MAGKITQPHPWNINRFKELPSRDIERSKPDETTTENLFLATPVALTEMVEFEGEHLYAAQRFSVLPLIPLDSNSFRFKLGLK